MNQYQYIKTMKEKAFQKWWQKQCELATKLMFMTSEEAESIGKAYSYSNLQQLIIRANDLIIEYRFKQTSAERYSLYEAESVAEMATHNKISKQCKRVADRLETIYETLKHYSDLKQPADRYATRDISGKEVVTTTRRDTLERTELKTA